MLTGKPEWISYTYHSDTGEWSQWRINLPAFGRSISLITRPEQLHLTQNILAQVIPQDIACHPQSNLRIKDLARYLNIVTDNLSRFVRSHLQDYSNLTGEPLYKVVFEAKYSSTPKMMVAVNKNSKPINITLDLVSDYQYFLEEIKEQPLSTKSRRKLYVTAKRILEGFPVAFRKRTPLRGLNITPNPLIELQLN